MTGLDGARWILAKAGMLGMLVAWMLGAGDVYLVAAGVWGLYGEAIEIGATVRR